MNERQKRLAGEVSSNNHSRRQAQTKALKKSELTIITFVLGHKNHLELHSSKSLTLSMSILAYLGQLKAMEMESSKEIPNLWKKREMASWVSLNWSSSC